MPLFTIITINLNNSEGLARTIASVAKQSFADFEYIVVDGNSKDDSVSVIEQNASVIQKWISEKDTGVYNAMNKGLAMATGEYILFLNSGDELKSDTALERFAAHKGSTFLFCDVELFGAGEDHIKVHPDVLTTRFLLTDMICHQAVFAKSDLFRKTGLFDESIRVYADYDWMLRALKVQKTSYTHIPEVLVRYHEIGISNTTNPAKQRKEKDAIHDKYFNRFLLSIYRLYRKVNDKKDGVHLTNVVLV